MTWKNSWQQVMQQTSTQVLQSLLRELDNDSEHILQGATVSPPPFKAYWGHLATHCCPVAYCLNGGLEGSVAEGERLFAAYLDEHPDLRCFLDFWDYAERVVAVPKLRDAVAAELEQR